MLSLVKSYLEKQGTYQHPQTRGMPNKKLREKRRRHLELSSASAATEEAGPSNTEQKSKDVRHDDETALDTAIPIRGSRFKEELPSADTPFATQGHFKKDQPAAGENSTRNVDIGLCIFVPRLAKEIEPRNISHAEKSRPRREPQTGQRQREERRTLSQEQMPPPPKPRDIQPSRINNRRRRNDESHRESTGFSNSGVAVPPGPQVPHLSRTNGELDSQVKSARHRRIQEKVRRNLGLHQSTSKEDESKNAENLPESSVAQLPGLVELCTTAYIMLTLKDPCPSMNIIAQKPGSVPNQTMPSKLVISEATRRQILEESNPEPKAHTRRDQHRKAKTASSMPNSSSTPPLEPASASAQEKTFFLEELMEFYQTRELHTINTGPATLYSCAAHDPKVEGAILAFPSFILLHAGKKYPKWPSLIFSSTEDTEEEFGCIHSLPQVHKDKRLDPVPVFKEVTCLIRNVSATDLKEPDGGTGSNTIAAGTVVEGSVPATPNSGIDGMTESGKRAKPAEQSKTTYSVLSEDSTELANGRDFEHACPEDFLEGRRATFLGWFDILRVRYQQKTAHALQGEIQRMHHEPRERVRVDPTPRKGSATPQVSPKVAETHNGEVRKETQMPPEGPTADANPMKRSFAATLGRMSPPLSAPPPFIWEPFNPLKRALKFDFSKHMEARASTKPPSLPPAPSSPPQSEKPEPPVPFTAHFQERDCWTLLLGEAFVNVTLARATPRSLGRVVDRHGEEALTNPLTKGYKHSVTVADDGLSCEIEGTDAPDGDAVYDAHGRRFGRVCAVRDRNSNGSGGDEGKNGSGSRPDGQNGVDSDGIHHDAGEGSSANANGIHNAEDHGHADNDSPDDIAGKEKLTPPDSTESPFPPTLTYRPSMTFTLPPIMASPNTESPDPTKTQRIIRRAYARDLQHILNILRSMCRLQMHRHLVEQSTLQLRGMKRLEKQHFERQEKRYRDDLRRMVASGEVEPNPGGVLEAIWRKRATWLAGKGRVATKKRDSDVPGGESVGETRKGDEGGGKMDTQAGEGGAKPDDQEDEGPDTTGATPMTEEEEERCRSGCVMSW